MHWPLRTSHFALASTGLPSAHASSATIDRLSKYDGMMSSSDAGDRVELVRVVEEPEMPDPRMRRESASSELPMSTSVSRPAVLAQVGSKKSNSSLQPLFSSMRPT